MNLKNIVSGTAPHDQFNVIIEIPMHGAPIKYEVDKASGALFVDRLMSTAMFYPANYGYIPKTLAEDGDPIDVLVITPVPIISASVITCRAVGLLNMTDEAGDDAKILAVPCNKVTNLYESVTNYTDLPRHLLLCLEHFFQHYKDLEENKWVKIRGWAGPTEAQEQIKKAINYYNKVSCT